MNGQESREPSSWSGMLGDRFEFGFTTGDQRRPDDCRGVTQVHRAEGYEVVDPATWLEREGDFLWTQASHACVGVKVADCTAVLISGDNPRGAFVGAIHAGWRGTAARILEAALTQINPQRNVCVWLSPSLCREHFEVGPEVLEALGALSKSFVISGPRDRFYLDLKGLQREILQRLLPPQSRIFASSLCTFCQPDFNSYRRSNSRLPTAQRHWAWIRLRSPAAEKA